MRSFHLLDWELEKGRLPKVYLFHVQNNEVGSLSGCPSPLCIILSLWQRPTTSAYHFQGLYNVHVPMKGVKKKKKCVRCRFCLSQQKASWHGKVVCATVSSHLKMKVTGKRIKVAYRHGNTEKSESDSINHLRADDVDMTNWNSLIRITPKHGE